MATFMLTASPVFPAGSSVSAYLARYWAGPAPQPGQPPASGVMAAVGTVDGHGFAQLAGLEADALYYVGAEVQGAWRWLSFRTTAVVEAGGAASALVFDPRTKGAKWDGVTDDTIPIQEAHDEAEAAGPGATLLIPPGVGVTKGLLWGSNVTIWLQGVLKLANHTTRVVGVQGDVICSKGFAGLAVAAIGGTGPGTSAGGVHDVQITGNGSLDGNRANQSAGEGGCGIRFYGYGYKFDKISVRSCVEWPVCSEGIGEATAANNSMEAYLTLLKAHDSGKGIYFNGPHDSFLIGVIPYGNDTGALGIDCGPRSNGVELVSCHPWAYSGKPMSVGARLRGSGSKVIGGQYEGHYEGGVGIALLASDAIVRGPSIFTPSDKPTGRGIQLGSTSEGVTCAGAVIDARISFCNEGPLDLQKHSQCSVKARVYLPKGKTYAGALDETSQYDVVNTSEGGAETLGNLFLPVPAFYAGGSGKGSQVQMPTKAGTPADGDFLGPVRDGLIAVDTTGNLLYYRSGGVWRTPVPGPESVTGAMVKEHTLPRTVMQNAWLKAKRTVTAEIEHEAEEELEIVWSEAFADTAYTFSLTVSGGEGFVVIKQVVSYSTTGVKVKVRNNHTSEKRKATIHAIAIHD